MKNLNEKLSEALDITPIEIESATELVELKTPVDDDAEFARGNIRNLIEKGNKAMDELLLVANASEHPRAYEVAAGLIKNLADLNKDLLEIQKRRKDLSPQEASNAKNINVDKAVFVGSTAELVKLLKTNK
jgi:Terminase DNA packaging enzyme